MDAPALHGRDARSNPEHLADDASEHIAVSVADTATGLRL
jgi:hypothetical protein